MDWRNAKANCSRHSAPVTKSRRGSPPVWNYCTKLFSRTGATNSTSETFLSDQTFPIAAETGLSPPPLSRRQPARKANQTFNCAPFSESDCDEKVDLVRRLPAHWLRIDQPRAATGDVADDEGWNEATCRSCGVTRRSAAFCFALHRVSHFTGSDKSHRVGMATPHRRNGRPRSFE